MFRTNPSILAQEHSDMLVQLHTEAMQRLIRSNPSPQASEVHHARLTETQVRMMQR